MMVDPRRTQALERRLRFEKALAYLSAGLALLTLIWRDWIELVFRIDPDGGSGAAEWAVVVALATLSVACAALARADRRRLLAISTAGSIRSGH